MATIETTFEIGQSVIFYDPNNCRILPGIITGVSYFKNLDTPGKESYYIKPNHYNSSFSVGPCPIDFVFKDKDSVLDFCVKLMQDIDKL